MSIPDIERVRLAQAAQAASPNQSPETTGAVVPPTAPGPLAQWGATAPLARLAQDTGLSGLISQRLPDGSTFDFDPQRALLSSSNTVSSLLDPSKFEPNPLNAYDRPTYHLRLFAANQLEFVQRAGDLLDMRKMLAALSSLEQEQKVVILAESGKTAGLNIKELVIKTIASFAGRTRNRVANDFSIVISEPSTVSFLDALWEASRKVGNRNFRTEIYYLEVSFYGYTESGEHRIPIPLPTGETSGRWVYPINFRDIDVALDAAGATYTIEAIPCGDLAMTDEEFFALRRNITLSGQTVGDMLNGQGGLATVLAEAWIDQYQDRLAEFEFRFDQPPGRQYPNPLQFRINARDPERSSIRNRGMRDNTPQAQFSHGVMIPTLIDELIGSTEEGQAAANVSSNQQGQQGGVVRDGFRETIVYRVQTETIPGEYDQRNGRHRVKIIYHIIPHVTRRVIIDQQQVQLASNIQAQQALVREVQDRGFLKKQFDYIHTGLNTDVLSCDIRMKLHWYTELASLYGSRRDQPSIEQHERFNPRINATNEYGTPDAEQGAATRQANETGPTRQIENQPLGVDLERGRRESERLDRLQGEARALAARSSSLTSAERARLAALNNEIDRNTSSDAIYDVRAYRALRDGAASPVVETTQTTSPSAVARTTTAPQRPPQVPEATPAPRQGAQGRSLFAEDLVNNRPTMPISIRQSDGESRQVFGGGMPGPSHRDKSVYGALLDQLYSAANDKLAEVTLDVRGDPYWLGASGLSSYAFSTRSEVADANQQVYERQTAETRTLNPNGTPIGVSNPGILISGDQHFILHFRYPTSFDEQTGQPVIRTSDMYSGLYAVREVTNTFADGSFKQTIIGNRLPLIDVGLVGSSPTPRPGAPAPQPDQRQPESPAAAVAQPAAPAAASPTPSS